MTDQEDDPATYRDGFIDGWKSVRGPAAAAPAIGPRVKKAGQTYYQAGYEHGREVASRR